MRITIQLIQNHVQNSRCCLVMSFDNQQFIFNVCESYQRYIKEHNLKFQPETRIFLTRMETYNTNGLFGLMLTMIQHKAGLGSRVYGPEGVVEMFKETLFLFWHNMLPYSIADLTGQHSIMKGLLHQKHIDQIVQDPSINQTDHYYDAILSIQQQENNSINDASYNLEEGIQGRVYKDNNATISTVVTKWQGRECLSYLIETKQQMGKVQMEKCKEKGIAKNQISLIMKGEPIIVNGEWVKPEDLVDQIYPGQAVLILDIPDLQVLAQLQAAKNEGRLSPKMTVLTKVVYLDSTLSSEPALLSFIQSFPSDVTHYYAPPNNPLPVPSLYRHHRLQKELSNFMPSIFQTPYYWQFPLKNTEPLLKISQKFHEDQLWPLKNQGYQAIKKNPSDQDTNLPSTDIFYKRLNKWTSLAGGVPDGRRVVFTGTGSMIPSTFRNVSGILVEFKHMAILMDCGEGTFNQLADSYSSFSDFVAVLLKIKIIFLTHIHCDHTIGTAPFLLKRKEVLESNGYYDSEQHMPFLIYSYNTHPWLQVQEQFIDPLPCRRIFTQQLCSNIIHPENTGLFYSMSKSAIYTHDYLDQMCASYQNTSDANAILLRESLQQAHLSIIPIPVDHCPQSFALAVEEYLPNEPPYKLCYSGDTRPCQTLVDQIQGYDVLIHECTYNDDKQAQAVTNQHTAVSECLQIATHNKVKWLYLTHFSQRYIKGFLHTPLDQYKDYYLHHTLVAYDNMHVHSGNIHQAVYLKNVLKEIATP